MADALLGSWNYESSENLEAFMDALGLPDNLKEIARNSKSKVEISRDGANWTIKTTLGDQVVETKYTENQETDTVNITGQTVKATLKVEGATLVETQSFGGVDMQIKRYVEGGKYIVAMTAKGTETKVKFAKA